MFDPRLTKPHYKSVIFASYFELLKERHPHVDIVALIKDAGLSMEYITNEDSWVSVTCEKRIMDLILERTGDKSIIFEAGKHGTSRTGLGSALFLLASHIIPLDKIYRSLPKLTPLLNKVMTVEIQESRNGYFKFIFKPNISELDPEEAEVLISRMPFVMENTKGYYGSLPVLKRLPPAHTKVKLVDADTGTYELELSYFANLKILGDAFKLLPLPLAALFAWGMNAFANVDLTVASSISYSVATTIMLAYLFSKTKMLRRISVASEESIYRLDTQNKDLYDAKVKLQRKLEESIANYQLVSHLISATMEEEVLQLGCECLVENLKYDRAFILLFHPKENLLRLAASKGLAPELQAGMATMVIPAEIDDLDPAKFTNVFKLNKPLIVQDVRAHMKKLKDPVSIQMLQASGTRSFVAAPISTQSSALGILVADCVSMQKIMTEDDLRMVSTAAHQIAIAVEEQRSKQKLVESYQKEVELSESYARFVPFETLKILNYKSIFDVKIGDYVDADVTIMFSDIRGFTTLCESMNPSEILKFLNSYYSRLSPIIKAHGGTIDKFMGDGVMAIFPEPKLALAAAIEIQRAIFKYNVQERITTRIPIRSGIGIASGRVVFGPLGSDNRLELTAIADTVNVASRLEGLCRELAENIVITGIPESSLGEFAGLRLNRLAPIKVKGRSGEVNVIAVSDEQFFEGLDTSPLNDVQLDFVDGERELWRRKLGFGKVS